MISLYTPRILRLAAGAADHPPIDNADARVRMRTPVCGSVIVLDLELDGAGRVGRVGYDVQACAVGQAAATIFAASAPGRTLDDLLAIDEELGRWLAGGQLAPPDWPDIDALIPARDTPARHAAIMLAFNAGARAARIATGQLLS